MKKFTFLIALLIFSQFAFSQLGSDDNKEKDQRVIKLLKALDFWDITSMSTAGNFKFTLNLGDSENRSQMIFISNSTNFYDKLEIREVYSFIYFSKEMPAKKTLIKLLEDNYLKKFGSWQLDTSDDEYAILFSAKISANCNAETLYSAIKMVIKTADSMEKELFGTDDY